jgi:hypothetical protein
MHVVVVLGAVEDSVTSLRGWCWLEHFVTVRRADQLT